MAVETIDIQISENGSRTVRRNFADLAGQSEKTALAIDTLKGALIGLSLAAGLREAIRLADAFTTLQNKLAGAGVEATALTTITGKLFEIANETRASAEATAAIYSRLALSSKELGTSYNDLLGFTKSLNQALILSGATGHEAAAGLLQLSQAIASNRLGGDELRSILEQLPVVADVIAKHMKVTRGELRALGSAGKITAKDILQAFQEARAELADRFARTIPTVSQAFTVLHNAALQFIGTFDKANGITRTLAYGIILLSNNLEPLAKAILVASAAVAVFAGAAGLGAVVRAWGALNVLLLANPFTAVLAGLAALVTLIAVFGDDILIGVDNLTTLKDLMFQFTGESQKGMESLVPTAKDYWNALVTDAKAKLAELTLEHGSAFAAINGTIAAYSKDSGSILHDFFINTAREIDGLMAAWNIAGAVIQKMWGDLLPILANAWRDFSDVVTTTWDIVTASIQEAWVNASNFIVKGWNSLTTTISDFASVSTNFIGAWAVAIADHIGNALPASIRGFFSDVYNWVAELFQKLLGLVGQAVNAIRELLGQAGAVISTSTSLGIDPTQISADLKKSLDNTKIYFGEIGNVARKALEDTGNPVEGWVNKSIEEAQKSARNRKDFSDMFFPAGINLDKRGKDLTKPAAGKGGNSKAAESMAKQILDLEKRINPAREAAAEFEKNLLLINKAYQMGVIPLAKYNELLEANKDHFRETVDEAFKARREFDALISTMQDAMKRGIGFTAEDAVQQVAKKYPDIFFGTDQEIKNKYTAYQQTIAQINALQQAQLITEGQANQMRLVQAGLLKNAIIQAGLAMAQVRLDSGAGDWADLWLTSLGRVQEGFTTFASGTSNILSGFYSSMIDGFANSVGRAIVYSEDLGDAMYKVAQGALADLISGFIKLALQWLINQAIGTSIAAAGTAASVAMGAAVAAAWAPAALSVSLATFGANAAGAIAGMTAAAGVQASLGTIGALFGSGSLFASGGYTGNSARSQIAGAVHGQEFVMNANATRRIGVPTLEAMQSGRVAPMAANNNVSGSQRPLNVVVQNYGTSKDFDVQQITEDEVRIIARDEGKKAAYAHSPKAVAADMNNPNGRVSKAMKNNTLTERRRSS